MNKAKKRVLFINPPFGTNVREDCGKLVNDKDARLPFDLMRLASIAEQCGCEVKISDYNLGGDLKTDLSIFQPHYVVANVSLQSFKNDISMLQIIKLAVPWVKIIVKGLVFLTYNTNAIYEKSFIDYIIIGEPELTLKEILQGVPEDEILGLCYRKNFQGVKNSLRPFDVVLDDLPYPLRDAKQTQAVIEISRGCPYGCFACLRTTMAGGEIRFRSVNSVIDEIKECIKTYKIKNFYFKSAYFNFDDNWVKEFCEKIIGEKLDITWSTEVLPSGIEQEIVNLMRKSGCRSVSVVIESGSQKILDCLKKGLKLDTITQTMNAFQQAKISISASFGIGHPWDSEETVNETINFAIKLNCDNVEFYSPAPLPGSLFYAYAMQTKLFEGNTTFDGIYKQPVIRSHKLTKERIKTLLAQAERTYNLRASYILKTLANKKGLKAKYNYLSKIVNLLKQKT